MPKKPTLSCVAKEAGVSVPTVSQVMRGAGRISPQTQEKVKRAAKKLHYVPNSRAASMRSGDNREIGFVLNRFANPFNAEVVSGAVDLLEAEGYLVSILDTRDDADRQGRQLEAFIGNGRGGLIWVPAANTPDSTIELLRTHRIPLITFLREISGEFDHVGIHNTAATAEATERLIELGHKRLAYLGGTEMASVREERVAGFVASLERHELGAPIIWPSRDNKRAGRAAVHALLEAHPDVTGIVCNGDVVALGACLGLLELGKTPGKEVSVIGFDDIEDASLATPQLSTMSISPHKLGARLAQTLLARMSDIELPVTKSLVSARYIERETTRGFDGG